MHFVPVVPRETARVARAAFPKGNPYLKLCDILSIVSAEPEFAALFAWRQRPALAPWRLAVILVLQFAEGLSDRQAAEAVRTRIDWKYVLCLDLADAGFGIGALAEFRTRLGGGSLEQRFLDRLLRVYRVSHALSPSHRRFADVRRMLVDVRDTNRVEYLAQTFRQALQAVSLTDPDWAGRWVPLDWYIRYGPLALAAYPPHGKPARRLFVATLRADGARLLEALEQADAPELARHLEIAQVLRRTWQREFSVRNGHATLRAVPPGRAPAAGMAR